MRHKLGGQQRVTLMLVVSLILQLFAGMNVYAEGSSIVTKHLGGMTAIINEIVLKDNQTNEEKTQENIGNDKENAITNDEIVNVYYKIHLDNPMDYTTGEALVIELPEALKVNTTEETYMSRIIASSEDGGDKVEIGTCEIDKTTGRGNIRFYDKIKAIDVDFMDITVGIQTIAHVEAGNNEDEIIKLPFIIEEVKIEVPVYMKKTGDNPGSNTEVPTIEKSCVGFDASTGEMIWEINIQGGTEDVSNIRLVDYFDETQMEFKKAYWEGDTTALKTEKNYVQDNTRTLEINIGDVLARKKKTLFITTVVKNSALTKEEAGKMHSFTNNAKLIDQAGDDLTPEVKAMQDVKVEWISKDGNTEAAGVRTISWKVKINAIHSNIGGYIVTDKLPKGLELVTDSVKLRRADGTAVEFGSVQQGGNIAEGEYIYKPYNLEQTEHVKYSKEGLTIDEDITYIGELQYQFPGEADYTSYELTYETKVTASSIENVNKKAMFYNYAALGDGKDILQYDYEGVGYEPNLIEKTGEYSRSNHTATWTITVNKSCLSIKDSKVIDDIPEEFELKEDSVRIKVAGEADRVIGREKSIIDDDISAYYTLEGQKLTINFIGEMKKSYEVVFDTPIKESNKKLYTTNLGTIKRVNEAILYDSNEKSLTEEPAKCELEIKSWMTDKIGATYNYATREITWLIHVNYNAMSITNARVKDIIPAGQRYVENSMKIKAGSNNYEKMKDVSISDIVPSITLEDKEEEVLLNIGIGNISKTYTIMYKTELTEEYAKQLLATTGHKVVENTAILYGDEIVEEGVKAKGTQEINSELLSKTGVQDATNEPIKWTITINKNQKLLDHIAVIDTLESGLSLETDSIHLYLMNVTEDGTLTVKEEVSLKDNDAYKLVYDNEMNKLEFSFLQPIARCYQLVFETEVIDENPASSYSNTAYISGSGIEGEQEANSDKVDTTFINSGGTMGKVRGSVEITKVDKDNPTQVLSGAVFRLIDYNGYIQGEKATDENGKVRFDNLRLNKAYTVQEVSSPEGYKLEEEPIIVKLTEKGEVKYYSFTNSKKVYNIQFKKVNEEGEGLQGARFELYSSEKLTQVIGTGTSDSKGNVSIEGITFGEYILKEIAAPSHYVKDEGSYSVVVAKDGSYVIKNSEGETVTTIINKQQETPSGGGGAPSPSPSPSRPVTIVTKGDEPVTEIEEGINLQQSEEATVNNNENQGNRDEKVEASLEDIDNGGRNSLNPQELNSQALEGNCLQCVNEEELPKLGDNITLKFIILLGGIMILTGSGLLSYRRKYYK